MLNWYRLVSAGMAHQALNQCGQAHIAFLRHNMNVLDQSNQVTIPFCKHVCVTFQISIPLS